jgi:adenylate cyclase
MIYSDYIKHLEEIQANIRNKSGVRFKGISGVPEAIKEQRKATYKAQKAFSMQSHLQLQPLHSILDVKVLDGAKLGQHPDFVHLKGTEDVEYHNIVSVFIDIKGSTNLFKKYDLPDVYTITNTMQSAAIHTCLALGGHIQRLQGDGVFAYFGEKGMDRKEAVNRAVLACSLFTYFVANDIKHSFLDDDIKNIAIRIGIDFGEDEDVLWANFGLADVSELTTLSLHTSLSSKMQTKARRNGIVIGKNVRDLLKLTDEFFDLVYDKQGKPIYNIFENPDESFYYKIYDFNWSKFLESLPNIKKDTQGKLGIVAAEILSIDPGLQKLLSVADSIKAESAVVDRSGVVQASGTGVSPHLHKFHFKD